MGITGPSLTHLPYMACVGECCSRLLLVTFFSGLRPSRGRTLLDVLNPMIESPRSKVSFSLTLFATMANPQRLHCHISSRGKGGQCVRAWMEHHQMSKLRKALHATKAPFHGSDPPIEAGVDPCTQLLRKNHAIHHRSDEKRRQKADHEPVNTTTC